MTVISSHPGNRARTPKSSLLFLTAGGACISRGPARSSSRARRRRLRLDGTDTRRPASLNFCRSIQSCTYSRASKYANEIGWWRGCRCCGRCRRRLAHCIASRLSPEPILTWPLRLGTQCLAAYSRPPALPLASTVPADELQAAGAHRSRALKTRKGGSDTSPHAGSAESRGEDPVPVNQSLAPALHWRPDPWAQARSLRRLRP